MPFFAHRADGGLVHRVVNAWTPNGAVVTQGATYGHPTVMVDQDPGGLADLGHGVLGFVGWVGMLIVLIYVGFSLARSARLVQQYEEGVVLRLGRYVRTAKPGFHLLIPFVERMIKVDRRTSAMSISGQEALSRDNVPVKMTVVAWVRINDARKSVVEIEDARSAVQKVALTSLVSAIGRNPMDELLKNRDAISEEMKGKIDAVTEAWGYEVVRVEIQNVEIPEQMQRAMAAVAEAGRDREALVIKADGELQASEKLAEAGRVLARSPGSLELRRLQTMAQIGAEQNSTIILALPVEFLKAAEGLASLGGTSAPAMPAGAPPNAPSASAGSESELPH